MLAWLLKDNNLLASAVILAVIALFVVVALYREKIGNLIDRLSPGSDAKAQPVTAQDDQPSAIRIPINIEPDSKEARKLADRWLSDLQNSSLDDAKKVEQACILGANMALRADFEIRYRILWGSQMDAILALRQKGPHPLDPYYQNFLERMGEQRESIEAAGVKTSFEDWVGFISRQPNSLVRLEGGVAQITELGDAFVEHTAKTAKFLHSY